MRDWTWKIISNLKSFSDQRSTKSVTAGILIPSLGRRRTDEKINWKRGCKIFALNSCAIPKFKARPRLRHIILSLCYLCLPSYFDFWWELEKQMFVFLRYASLRHTKSAALCCLCMNILFDFLIWDGTGSRNHHVFNFFSCLGRKGNVISASDPFYYLAIKILIGKFHILSIHGNV